MSQQGLRKLTASLPMTLVILILVSLELSLMSSVVGQSTDIANVTDNSLSDALIAYVRTASSWNVTPNQLPGVPDTMSATAACNKPKCGECLEQDPLCLWCVHDYRCVHNSTGCGTDVAVATYAVNETRTVVHHSCPRISDRNPEKILIPSGVNRTVRIEVDLAGHFMRQEQYDCFYFMERGFVFVDAQLIADQIYCGPTEFKYTIKKPDRFIVVGIRYGKRLLENPTNLAVWVYQCKEMAKNRDSCFAVDEKYNCGWCGSSNTCEIRDDCDSQGGSWIDRRYASPSPQNISFVAEPEL